MTLRLTPEQDRALTLLAEAQGSTVAQLARDVLPGHAALESRIRRSRG